MGCVYCERDHNLIEKSAQRDANTGGAKNFRPAADPFPGAQDGQNVISWR